MKPRKLCFYHGLRNVSSKCGGRGERKEHVYIYAAPREHDGGIQLFNVKKIKQMALVHKIITM
jgi:hypothetical protein